MKKDNAETGRYAKLKFKTEMVDTLRVGGYITPAMVAAVLVLLPEGEFIRDVPLRDAMGASRDAWRCVIKDASLTGFQAHLSDGATIWAAVGTCNKLIENGMARGGRRRRVGVR